ncbi:hypothetical protein Btru_035795 [Bulinus truncatus]|nr:hypothetical protein Btru_035795 [Bulinus truncatus]
MDQEQSLDSQQSLLEHRIRLSPSTVGSVYPALQNLQRISQGHGEAHPLAAHSDSTNGTTLINDRYTSQTLPSSHTDGRGQGLPHGALHHSSFGHHDGPSIISAPSLPSYPLVPPPATRQLAAHSWSLLCPTFFTPTWFSKCHRPDMDITGNKGTGTIAGGPGMGWLLEQGITGIKAADTEEPTEFILPLRVFCVVTGIVLAAIRSAGNSFLFLAIMFIGLGVLLVIVVGVGWKCTPRGHEPLHALFGIGNFRHGHVRTRRPRRHRNREGNWFGGYLYPEFQYRRPPPSYAASMQDYQNQDIPSDSVTSVVQDSTLSAPSSPPPSYRSRASTVHSGIHITFNHDGDLPNSRPPTYRSRAPSRRPSIILDNSHASLYASLEGDTTEIVDANDGLQELASSGQPSSSVTLVDIKNVMSGAHLTQIPPSSSQLADSNVAQNLHQRMASEDRQVLEQTLQSLEEHISETGGFTNEGARFDELELAPDYNTYL